MPDDLARQIAPLHELVRAHGWPLLMVEGVEADDVIATLATQAAARGIDCLVSTSDKDLAQLVRPGITLVNTMSNETLDEAGVVQKFGVRADQVLDLLTLTGDAVDNVPGVAKVGPKTAAKWLERYGTLDNVVAHAAEIPGVVGENLRLALDWLPQGRRLLTVKTDCALPVAPEDLRIDGADAERLKALFQRFEFRSWIRDRAGGDAAGDPAGAIAGEAARQDLRRFAAADPPSGRRRRRCRGTTRPSSTRRRCCAGRPRSPAPKLVAFDTETTGLDPMAARIVGLSFAVAPGARLLHPARAPLSRRAGPALAGSGAGALRAVVRRPSPREARAEPQVRPARAGQPRHRARRRRARHAAGVVRAGVAPAARHGQPRLAPCSR